MCLLCLLIALLLFTCFIVSLVFMCLHRCFNMFECLCPMHFNVFLSVLKVGEGSRRLEKVREGAIK